MTRSARLPRALGGAAAVALVLAACAPSEKESGEPSTPAAARQEPGAAVAPTAPADSSPRGRADQARIRGDSTAPVWLVMVSDFQCPYCKLWHDSTFAALDREYVRSGKVRMAYLNYPLPSHKHAWPAAQAAMCAGAQGKFWEMHDLIFETQREWTPLESSEAFFEGLAARAGADPAALRRCTRSGALRPLIQADMDRSAASGISSTPTFIVGDSVIEGAHPVERFRAVLDAALKGAN